MEDARSLHFSGSRAETGPSTWGQREQWATMRANRPHDARFNARLLWPVPTGCSMDDVTHSLTALIERHEALRTTFPAGIAEQRVAGAGIVPLRLLETDDESIARAEVAALAGRRFDLAAEWPVRFTAIHTSGVPRWIAASTSHVTLDLEAVRIAERDFRALLVGKPLPPDPLQPLEQARYEQSPDGRAALDRAVASWREGLASARVPLIPPRAEPCAGPQHPAVAMTSRDLGRRVRDAATGGRTSVPAVLTAAAAAILTAFTGDDRCALIITCANRHRPEVADYVGTIAQQGLVPLRTGGRPFADLVRDVWRARPAVSGNSVYDIDTLDAVIRDRSGGRCPTVYHYVNVVEDFPVEAPAGPCVIEDLPPVPSTMLHFGLAFLTDGEHLAARMFCDRRYLSADDMRTILRGVDTLLRAEI